MNTCKNFTPQLTDDGSFTFFSTEFGESFHSRYGAKEETIRKFVEPTELREKALQPSLQLLDICYGLGYNTATALATIWDVNPNCRVEWIGLELDATVPQSAIAHQLLNLWSNPIGEILTELASTYQVETDNFHGILLMGDARTTLKKVHQLNFQADAIFLDPFSPPHCPQLWTVEFLGLAAKCLNPDGRLATYSCAAAVRTALMAVDLKIGSTAPFGRRSPGTVANFTNSNLSALSQEEEEHLQTRASIPYRDPQLCDSASEILQRRQIEQQNSELEPTSHWKKRWTST